MDPRDAANRDLLVGLLALQNGLVDQDALVAAFRAWSRDKSTPIAAILAQKGAIDGAERALLEGLAEKHIHRHGGDPGRSLAALNPDVSTRESLAGIGDTDLDETIAQVGSSSGTGPADRTGTFQAGDEARRFRVLRPHARGGLGAVFVALDEELNREVALKQILDHHADDPTSRTRFVLEAEITGGLEHPGIVPVYGLGSDRDGRPYYAMRFVRGETLKDAIAAFHVDRALKADSGRRSLAIRKLLRRFVDVCNAIEYAHTRGVLHRDIKPANVILGKHGETLVVDWGLAKLIGSQEPGRASDERTLMPSSASGSAETLPGSALGTPAYMSPEQAAGDLDRLGPRSEVYSLGATLYCLLTGRAPFEGGDLGSLLRAVRSGTFRPPRAIDPGVDRALEAVCLKAMATDPAGRYATPRALAEDVERWTADEPVLARREPILSRAGRWARRHRTKVAAVGLSLVTAVILLAIANVRVRRAQSETQKALDRADVNFRRARQAVEDSFTIISEEILLEEPGMQPLREKLLQTGLKYHEVFLKERAGDPGVEAELAESHWRYGCIALQLGRAEQAREHLRIALRGFEALVAGDPDNLEFGRKVALTHTHIGWTFDKERDGYEETIAGYRKGIARFEALLVRVPKDAQCREGLAWTLGMLGQKRAERRGGAAEAREVLLRARGLSRGLAADFPGNLRLRKKLVDLHGFLYSRYIGDKERQAEAIASSREAEADMEAMLRASPRSVSLQFQFARLLMLRRVMHERAGEFDQEISVARRASEILTALAAANPDVWIYRTSLAEAQVSVGRSLMQTGRSEEALAPLRTACDLLRAMTREKPSDGDAEKAELVALTNLGSALLVLQRFDEAAPVFRRSLEPIDAVCKRDPGDIFARGTALSIRTNLAICLSRSGQHVEAIKFFEESRAIARETFGDPDWSHEGKKADTERAIRAYSLREIGQAAEADALIAGSREDAASDAFTAFEIARYDARSGARLAASGAPAAEVRALEDRAIEGVRLAGKLGSVPPADVDRNDAFQALRGRPEFADLLLDLSFPAFPYFEAN